MLQQVNLIQNAVWNISDPAKKRNQLFPATSHATLNQEDIYKIFSSR